jgi:hypothetical protein
MSFPLKTPAVKTTSTDLKDRLRRFTLLSEAEPPPTVWRGRKGRREAWEGTAGVVLSSLAGELRKSRSLEGSAEPWAATSKALESNLEKMVQVVYEEFQSAGAHLALVIMNSRWEKIQKDTSDRFMALESRVQRLEYSLAAARRAPQSLEEFASESGLHPAMKQIEQLATELLGTGTEVAWTLDRSRESDEFQAVAEIRYPQHEDSKSRLRQFMVAYSDGVPVEAQQRIALIRLPL